MVGKIQRGYRHPCSVSFCAKPPSIWSPGIVSPMAGRPIVSFPSMAVSFFVGCFWGWKSGLRISSFLAFSFLVLSFAFVLVIILACAFVWVVRAKTTLLIAIIAFWQAFLAFVSCGPPSKVLFWPNFGILCLFFAKECSSASLGYTFVLSFSLSFSSFQLAALTWSGLPDTLSVVPCPETWSFIINVTLLASHFILGPLSKVVFSIVFHDGGSVHATDVSAHAEWRILHRAFRLTK